MVEEHTATIASRLSHATSGGEMGELVYTKLNQPGYPEVAAVNTGAGVLPWWVVLGVELV